MDKRERERERERDITNKKRKETNSMTEYVRMRFHLLRYYFEQKHGLLAARLEVVQP